MQFSGRYFITILAAISLLFVTACSKSDSGESKERVLKKQDVTEAVKSREVKLQAIDLTQVPGNTKELEKLLLMTQEEIAARMAPYGFESETTYTTARKEKEVSLSEKQTLQQAENGDFHLVVFNNKARSYELFWVDGKIFERMGDSSFRSGSSGGKHLFWREKAYASLDRFYKYFRGNLKFKPAENVTFEGRKALKFAFELDPNGQTPKDDLETNYNFPDQYALSAIAVDKMVNKNRKRVSRFEIGEGYLIVDQSKAAVVAYKLKGKYAVPLGEKRLEMMKEKGITDMATEVVFTMEASYTMKEIGKRVELVPPAHRRAATRTRPPEDVKPLLPKGAKPSEETLKKSPAKPAEKEENN